MKVEDQDTHGRGKVTELIAALSKHCATPGVSPGVGSASAGRTGKGGKPAQQMPQQRRWQQHPVQQSSQRRTALRWNPRETFKQHFSTKGKGGNKGCVTPVKSKGSSSGVSGKGKGSSSTPGKCKGKGKGDGGKTKSGERRSGGDRRMPWDR